MKSIPQSVSKAWDEREPLVVLSTVSKDGIPNSIFVGVSGRYDDRTFFLANYYFSKTKQNILNDGKASLLFLTKDRKSYQIKGTMELQDSGPVYEAMKEINPSQYPAISVAVLHVEEVFAGALKLA
jgi:predicted pyridoxine 5'-phosphate oxidase superfamily flavin-nucleotide-binding protein